MYKISLYLNLLYTVETIIILFNEAHAFKV